MYCMQAVFRYACHVGLKTVMANTGEIRRVVHLLIGLVLLPPQNAEQGLQVS